MRMHLINSQILHRKEGGTLKSLEFRIELIKAIVEKYGYDVDMSRRGGRPIVDPNPFRLMERHFPSNVPTTSSKELAQRRCEVCKKNGTRKSSRFQFARCDVGLYPDLC